FFFIIVAGLLLRESGGFLLGFGTTKLFFFPCYYCMEVGSKQPCIGILTTVVCNEIVEIGRRITARNEVACPKDFRCVTVKIVRSNQVGVEGVTCSKVRLTCCLFIESS